MKDVFLNQVWKGVSRLKKVFLIVSDLHLSGSEKKNRVSYEKEIQFVFKKIVSLVEDYKAKGCSVNIIFLGDIFDRSYKSPQRLGVDSSFFTLLYGMCDCLYTVVGNHELTFYVNNPFWTLVNSVNSNRVMESKYNTQPLGYTDILNIVDTLEIGDTVFHFNHYGCMDSEPYMGKKNIALYHKSVYNKQLLEDARQKGLDVNYADNIAHQDTATLLRYDYAFLGHMHWFYGTWKDECTYIYGLGSLGRPAISEVADNFLERNIPAIVLEEDKFSNVEDNIFNLPRYEETIVAEVVTNQHEKYEISKLITEAKTYQSCIDDPISSIQTFLVDQPRTLSVFNSLVGSTFNVNSIVASLNDITKDLYK